MELLNAFPRYTEALLRLFYPSSCATCGQLLELEERGLCLLCVRNVERLKLFPSEERIRVSFTHGDEGWALFRYESPVKEIFHKIKFSRRRDLLRIFAAEIDLFLARRTKLATYDYLVPIPLDPKRRLEREFNQSSLIATDIYSLLKKRGRWSPQPCPLPHLSKRGLLKHCSTSPQSLLGKEARRLNLNGVFRVPRFRRFQNKSVLLIDDIFTTGATFEEAAKTLKRAGASRVGCFALARAISH